MVDLLRSLNALRAFESTARHESFSIAAEELNVSHSTISKHVKNLEDRLETQLFTRHGNRIELTKEGKMLLPQIVSAFQILRDACDGVIGSNSKTVVNISAEPAISSRWLRKKITAFCSENQKLQVELKPAWTPSNFGDQQINMVIHFEERVSHLRKNNVKRLFPIDAFPVCSPGLYQDIMEKSGTVDFSSIPLVHDNGREVWRKWYEKFQPKESNWKKGKVYSDLSLAIDAAVDGEGVFLADPVLCDRELKAGSLVILDERLVRCAWYVVVIEENDSSNSAVTQLQQWLLAQ